MVVTGGAQSVWTGGGLSSLTHWSIDTQSFGGKFGEQCAAQLVGLAVCLVSLHLREDHELASSQPSTACSCRQEHSCSSGTRSSRPSAG